MRRRFGAKTAIGAAGLVDATRNPLATTAAEVLELSMALTREGDDPAEIAGFLIDYAPDRQKRPLIS